MIACSRDWIRAAAVGLALMALGGEVLAQSPSPAAVAVARQVVDLKGGMKLYEPVLTGIVIRAKDTLLQANPMLEADLNASAQTVRREIQPRLDEVKTQMATVYATHFSEQELKEVLAFYQSPLGAKVLKTEPRILEQTMGFADKWARELADEVLMKMRAEMRKRGHDL
jgi:hypothetical protein